MRTGVPSRCSRIGSIDWLADRPVAETPCAAKTWRSLAVCYICNQRFGGVTWFRVGDEGTPTFGGVRCRCWAPSRVL